MQYNTSFHGSTSVIFFSVDNIGIFLIFALNMD